MHETILYQIYIVIYSSLLLDTSTVQQANMANTEQSVPVEYSALETI